MLVIKNPTKVPPGGYWRYKDKDTGASLSHPYLQTLQQQVIKHRAANKLEFDPVEFIQNLCDNTGSFLCAEGNEKQLTPMQQVLGFTKSMATWMIKGMERASPEVLEMRVKQCYSCKHWGGAQGGSLISGRCGLCGCRGVKLALATSSCPAGRWA